MFGLSSLIAGGDKVENLLKKPKASPPQTPTPSDPPPPENGEKANRKRSRSGEVERSGSDDRLKVHKAE